MVFTRKFNINFLTKLIKAVQILAYLEFESPKATAFGTCLTNSCRISGLKVSEISGKLTVMELKGIVKNIGNGVYKKV